MTSLDRNIVDEVDEKQREFLDALEPESEITKILDEEVMEVFTAPSKHARDIYNILWMEALGTDYDREQKVEVGAANQWHHNTSLLADDFMDEDFQRRGVDTFHVSDFLTENFPDEIPSLTMTEVIRLTSLPYAVINSSDGFFSEVDYETSIPQEHQAPVSSILASNVSELASGQVEDLTGPARLQIEDDKVYVKAGEEELGIPEYYFPMAEGKTSRLFEASANTGAVAAEYTGNEPVEHAKHLGILLQYTDDLVDLQEGSDKDFMSDFKESKPTMLVHYALNDLEGYDRRRVRDVLEAEEPVEEDLHEVKNILEQEKIVDKAYNDAATHLEHTQKLLSEAPVEHPEYADDLNNLAEAVLYRAK